MPGTLKRTGENAEVIHKQREKRIIYTYKNTMEYVTKL